MQRTPSFARSLPVVLALLVPSIASASTTYPGDTFTLRQDASGAIWREDFVLPVEIPAVEPAPQPEATPHTKPQRSGECVLPASAISSTDSIEHFPVRHGRFSKVPRYLVPIYEQTCEDYDIPVRYLAAGGSYESHFRPTAMGDSGTSCGIHMFRDVKRKWTNWGFERGLTDCHDPEQNIRKAGEHWRTMMKNGRTLRAAIKKHNGAGPKAERYVQTIMGAADRYYR